EIGPGDEHDRERSRTDKDGRAQIHLGDDQGEQQTNDRNRDQKSAPELPALAFVTRKPKGEEKDGCDLGELRRLTSNAVEFEPTPRTIDLVPERREKTERQPNQGAREPKPPAPLPKMVIDQRARPAGDHPDPEPDGVPAEKIINVVVTVLGERARAEKDDDADRQQSKDGEKEKVGALP